MGEQEQQGNGDTPQQLDTPQQPDAPQQPAAPQQPDAPQQPAGAAVMAGPVPATMNGRKGPARGPHSGPGAPVGMVNGGVLARRIDRTFPGGLVAIPITITVVSIVFGMAAGSSRDSELPRVLMLLSSLVSSMSLITILVTEVLSRKNISLLELTDLPDAAFNIRMRQAIATRAKGEIAAASAAGVGLLLFLVGMFMTKG